MTGQLDEAEEDCASTFQYAINRNVFFDYFLRVRPLFAQAQDIRNYGLNLKISQVRIFHTFWIV